MIAIASALLAASTMASDVNSLFSSNFEQFNCPAGRLDLSQVAWRTDLLDTTPNVDVTQFENIWGRTSPTDNIVPFPGDNVHVYFAMNRQYFISAKFVVPANLAATTIGGFTHGSNNPGPAMDMSISSECGNFAPAGQFCAVYNKTVGQPMVQWKVAGSSETKCPLTLGQTYYVNIRLTDPYVQDPSDCGSPGEQYPNLCIVGINNNFTP